MLLTCLDHGQGELSAPSLVLPSTCLRVLALCAHGLVRDSDFFADLKVFAEGHFPPISERPYPTSDRLSEIVVIYVLVSQTYQFMHSFWILFDCRFIYENAKVSQKDHVAKVDYWYPHFLLRLLPQIGANTQRR